MIDCSKLITLTICTVVVAAAVAARVAGVERSSVDTGFAAFPWLAVLLIKRLLIVCAFLGTCSTRNLGPNPGPKLGAFRSKAMPDSPRTPSSDA